MSARRFTNCVNILQSFRFLRSCVRIYLLEAKNRILKRILVSESDDEISEETLIQKYQLLDLCSEAAKLKSLGCMESIPTDRLIRLLGILEKNIRSGIKVSPIADDVSVNVVIY